MTTALVGTNWFELKTELDRLVAQFVEEHGDLALERIDCEETTYEQLASSIESLPFLASKKMVVASNLSANKDITEKLDVLIEKAGDTTDLVIVESKVDKRGSYYKQLKKLAGFKEFNHPDAFALNKWVQEYVVAYGGTIRPQDASYLVERIGQDQTRLSKELEKLLQYESAITKQTIDELTEETPSSTIFNLIESAFTGNVKRSLQLYDEQRAQRVEPQAILGMLVWQMHIVSIVSFAPESKTSDQIAKDAGLNPYVVKKSQSIASKMGRDKVNKVMTQLRDIDRNSKTKAINFDDSLKYLIVALAT